MTSRKIRISDVSPTDLNLGSANGTNRITSYADVGKFVYGKEFNYTNLAKIRSLTTVNWTGIMTGDSTTVGGGIQTPSYIPNTQQQSLLAGRGIRATIVNQGQSGKDTQDYINTYLAQDLALTQPNFYVIRWGLNDPYYGISPATTIANIRSALATIIATWPTTQTAILLCSPNTSSDDIYGRNEAWHETVAVGYAEAARDYGVMFFDIYQYIRTARQTVPRGTLGNWLYGASLNDGQYVHPNEDHENLIQGAIADILFPREALEMSFYLPQNLTVGTGFTQPGSSQNAVSYLQGRNLCLGGYLTGPSTNLTLTQTVATIAPTPHRVAIGSFMLMANSWNGTTSTNAANWEQVPLSISANGTLVTMKASANICARIYFDGISLNLLNS